MSGPGDSETSCIFCATELRYIPQMYFWQQSSSLPGTATAVISRSHTVSTAGHSVFRHATFPSEKKKGTVLTETGPFSQAVIFATQQFYLRFDILTVVTTKTTVFCDVTPCTLVCGCTPQR